MKTSHNKVVCMALNMKTAAAPTDRAMDSPAAMLKRVNADAEKCEWDSGKSKVYSRAEAQAVRLSGACYRSSRLKDGIEYEKLASVFAKKAAELSFRSLRQEKPENSNLKSVIRC